MSDHDLSKLPRWARERIEVLERDLADARAKLAIGPEDSDTFADPYSSSPRPLGRGTIVRFGDDERAGTYKVHFEEGQLRVQFAALGSYDLAIRPYSSNSFRLEGTARYRKPVS